MNDYTEAFLEPAAEQRPIRRFTLFGELGPAMRAALGADPEDTQVIEQALVMERASVEHYARQAEAAGPEGPGAFYERLAAEEREHVEILENTRTYLTDTGHWFLWDEQSILDGG